MLAYDFNDNCLKQSREMKARYSTMGFLRADNRLMKRSDDDLVDAMVFIGKTYAMLFYPHNSTTPVIYIGLIKSLVACITSAMKGLRFFIVVSKYDSSVMYFCARYCEVTVTRKQVLIGAVTCDDTPTYYPVSFEGESMLQESSTDDDSDTGNIRCVRRCKRAKELGNTILCELDAIWYNDGRLVVNKEREVHKMLQELHIKHCMKKA